VSFRQVCLTPGKHGGPAAAEAEARRLAAALEKKGPGADAPGDSLLLPPDMPLAPKGEIARVFGSEFADAVVALEPGHWTGGPSPRASAVHAVLVRREGRRAPRRPADVRASVERDFTGRPPDARARRALRPPPREDTVVIERPGEE